MQALTLTEIKGPLVLEDRADLKPGPGEVVVRVKAAALNRRDFWITQGMYPGIKPPVVLGSDGAGVVASCGEGVSSTWEERDVIIDPGIEWGDRQAAHSTSYSILGVPADGTFASQVVVKESQLHEKPAHLDWTEAAGLPLAGLTAYRAVFSQAQLTSDETILITGIGGGVATFALLFAVAAGADVWVTSSSSGKIQRAVELGAKGGFDYRDEDWATQLAERPDLKSAPDVIIDSAGGPGYSQLVEVAGQGARIVSYGATMGPAEKLDLFKVFWKQLRLQGTTMGSPSDFAAMLEFVNAQKLRPIIDRVFPLTEGNEALNLMQSSPQFGKYVLAIE